MTTNDTWYLIFLVLILALLIYTFYYFLQGYRYVDSNLRDNILLVIGALLIGLYLYDIYVLVR